MSSNAEHLAHLNAQIKSLEDANSMREPVLRDIIAALQLTPGSHGLDLGCGLGLQSVLLADALGSAGRVTGVDISPELLAYARTRTRSLPQADRITFREGDMRRLPFPDRTFDWAWSADCVGYPAGDLVAVLNEIARVTRPGGTLAILAWTSQQVLPGYGLLEARLNATCSAYAPYLQPQPPHAHFMRALHAFAAAGLTDVTARTFVGNVQAPLTAESRTALTSLFAMLWDTTQLAADSPDGLDYRRLCDPASPDFVLNLPDYYAFFTYTVFTGCVAK